MQEIRQNINEETIDIFVPIQIKKRGGTAMVICPKNTSIDEHKSYFDDKLIKMIGKAHKWKNLMEEGKFDSLADIARKEKVGTSYVSKVFNLNFLSPKIVKAVLTGTQPRTLKLQDIIAKQMPDLGQEAEKIFNIYLTNQYAQKESSKLKLKQTDKNYEAFKSIINEVEFEGYSNVTENYSCFMNAINHDNFSTILKGLNSLIFVEISLSRDKDDPQRIFESLNSTGLDLSQSDLIRNFILMDLEPKDQDRIFERVWSPIEENAKNLTTQKSLVSDYMRDYLTLRNKKIPNKNKVYFEFKNLYLNKKDESYYRELDKIKSFSIHYKKLINPYLVTDNNLKRELEYINRLEVNVAFPFLIQVLEDVDKGDIDNNDLIKILQLIQSYVWRRFIAGLPTNALNKIFMTLYADVDKEQYYDSIVIALKKKKGSGKFPTNDDLKTALIDKDLYNIQSKNRNYMFEMLENFNNREFVDTSNDNITIEHIFPNNPCQDWNSDLSSEEYLLFKEKYLNTIGNLTLSGNNGSLSNKSFVDKKKMNVGGGEQGYEFSRLWLNSYLKEIDSWNLENHQERSNIIYDRFLKIWKYPDVKVPETDDNNEQNIFDAESPTHKKLEYFIFENKRVEINAVAHMYLYVVENLYHKNAQLLLNNQEILKITRNSSDFRSAQELINGYFIEMNIDSNTKFNTLKKLLCVYGLEDELIIKYDT